MLEHNGKWYARVTEVLSEYSDFSHIPKATLENKQRIGTNVHEAIHDWIVGDFTVLSDDERGYFESYREWEACTNPRFIQAESRYYNDTKMVTGQIDGLVFLEGDTLPVLIDYKTSAAESKSWPLQGHIYHWMIASTGTIIAPRILFIKLDKEGKMPKVFCYEYDPNIRAQGLQAIDNFWLKNNSVYQNSQIA
jgi:ATP-dependent exoDNAse (exonuclease V) beta subunit